MPKRHKNQNRTEAMNALVETTMASFVPGLTRPLSAIQGFTDDERANLVQRVKSLFPGATDERIERSIFGNMRRTMQG